MQAAQLFPSFGPSHKVRHLLNSPFFALSSLQSYPRSYFFFPPLFTPKMLASIALTIAALAYNVAADPVPLEPSSTSVFDEGSNCTILW